MRTLKARFTRNNQTAQIHFHLDDSNDKSEGHIDFIIPVMMKIDVNLDLILCSEMWHYQYTENDLASIFHFVPALKPVSQRHETYHDFTVTMPLYDTKDALNLLAAIDDYCESFKIDYFVLDDGNLADEKTIAKRQRTSSVARKLAEEFLNFCELGPEEDGDAYRLYCLRNDLHALLDYSRKENLDFRNCLNSDTLKTACALYEIEYNKLLDPALSQEQRLLNFCELKRVLESKDASFDMEPVLCALQKTAVIRLIYPCIGKEDPDHNIYNLCFTEFTLLYSAPFALNQDGLMGIKFADSAYYQRYYVEDKHAKFELEMKHLAKHLGLEFTSADWKSGFVLTKESTEKLLNAGVLLVWQFREMQKTQNGNSAFFKGVTEKAPQKVPLFLYQPQ